MTGAAAPTPAPELADRDLATIVAARLRAERHHACTTASARWSRRACRSACGTAAFGSFTRVPHAAAGRRVRRRADGAARRDRHQPHVLLPRAAALRLPAATSCCRRCARGRADGRFSAGARRARPARSRTRIAMTLARVARRRRRDGASACWRRTCRRRCWRRPSAGVYKVRAGRRTCRRHPACRSTSSAASGAQRGLAVRSRRRCGRGSSSAQLNLLEIGDLGAAVRLHLLPQRDDLLRPAGAAARRRAARAAARARAATCSSRTPRA